MRALRKKELKEKIISRDISKKYKELFDSRMEILNLRNQRDELPVNNNNRNEEFDRQLLNKEAAFREKLITPTTNEEKLIQKFLMNNDFIRQYAKNMPTVERLRRGKTRVFDLARSGIGFGLGVAQVAAGLGKGVLVAGKERYDRGVRKAQHVAVETQAVEAFEQELKRVVQEIRDIEKRKNPMLKKIELLSSQITALNQEKAALQKREQEREKEIARIKRQQESRQRPNRSPERRVVETVNEAELNNRITRLLNQRRRLEQDSSSDRLRLRELKNLQTQLPDKITQAKNLLSLKSSDFNEQERLQQQSYQPLLE